MGEEFQRGLAAGHPGDKDISKHPAVIFADDFETGELADHWDRLQAPEALALTSDPQHAHGGQRALQITATMGQNTGGALIRWFMPGHDRVFARFYVKFAPDMGYVHHFVHLVANRADDRWSGFGRAGLRPEGDDRFTTGIEPWGNWGRHPPPGAWHFYSYWHQMKGAPDGKYWGNGFAPEQPAFVQRERWTCVEFMIQANSGGQANGGQAFWIDGERVGQFDGIAWHTDDGLKINAFWLLFYVTGNEARQNRVEPTPVSRVWFDDVVVATEYIGPRVE